MIREYWAKWKDENESAYWLVFGLGMTFGLLFLVVSPSKENAEAISKWKDEDSFSYRSLCGAGTAVAGLLMLLSYLLRTAI